MEFVVGTLFAFFLSGRKEVPLGHPISFKASGIHLPHFLKKTSSIAGILPQTVDAERKDLRTALRLNLERGLVFSGVVHVVLVGVYDGIEYLRSMEDAEPVLRVRIMKYSDLGPPPSITNSLTAPAIGVAKVGKPSIGMPIPVPDAEINPEQTIATQTEMSTIVGPAVEKGEGEGGERVEIADDVSIEDDEPGMGEFIPVEKSPQIIGSVQPDYPDIARRAGVEGIVWVNILVDKTGKPKKAVVVKEDGAGIFNDAAIKAAMKYKFTPAVMNSGPVQVWVSVKFKFQLVNKN